MSDFKLPVDLKESLKCPIGETIVIIDKTRAWGILKSELECFETTFLNMLHAELLHNILQRNSPAEFILLTPNIVAELFSMDDAIKHRDYIARRLIGTVVEEDHLSTDRDILWRQTYRKMLKTDKVKLNNQLWFFYQRQPNWIYQDTEDWRFGDTQIYKDLKKLYRALSSQ